MEKKDTDLKALKPEQLLNRFRSKYDELDKLYE